MQSLTHIPTFDENSNDMALIQTALVGMGFSPGKVDGIYGPKTRNAIANFQEANDLVDDGILGPKTLKALGFVVKTPITGEGYAVLSWEKGHPERAIWSAIVYAKINALWSKLQLCTDMDSLRPDYNTLNEKQQKSIWGGLICAIALYESGWKPTSWMTEKTMGTDPVTKKQVKSEGLLQLSYQDKRSYHQLPCDFDWEADKYLDQNDPAKTIFNPQYNLEFGIEILARQVERYQLIAMKSNVYWAVLKINGRYSKLLEISKILRGINFQ